MGDGIPKSPQPPFQHGAINNRVYESPVPLALGLRRFGHTLFAPFAGPELKTD